VRKALLRGLLALGFVSSGAAAQEVALLAHEATYELRLAATAGRGDMDGAGGLLALVVEDGCDTWNVRQGLLLTISRQDTQITTASDFASQEAKDGSRYRFDDRTSMHPGGEESSSGQATASPGKPGSVHVDRDEAVLPAGTLFPSAHLRAILRGATAGERLMNHVLYDGTDGVQIQDVTTLIGPARQDPESGLLVWPVRLAFYAHGSAAEVPELEISARLRQDGVALALTYDYGAFALDAVLASLEPLPAPDC
jgi:hypothetical protein